MKGGPLALAAFSSFVVVACAKQPGALVRFGRLPNPVLLGPVVRIGGEAPPPAQPVDRFDYVGVRASGSHSTEDNYTRTTTISLAWTTDEHARRAGAQATGGDTSLDVRLTDVEAYNWASVGGAVQKVFVKGDIVRVEAGAK